jgi:uncharacterized protein (TIGR02453 family)
MAEKFNIEPVLIFLSKLRSNNNKEWFTAHRSDYDDAREQFALFLDALEAEVGKFDDLGGIHPRSCIMRIYRDIRFSADKSPYRTHLGVSFGPPSHLPYYIHIEPFRASMIAGGMYMPSPAQLARFRSAVDRNAAPLKKVIRDAEFTRYYGEISGEKLKTAPREYARDHPEIELLRMKQILAMHAVADEDVFAPEFLEQTAAACRALKPLLEVLQEMAGPDEAS